MAVNSEILKNTIATMEAYTRAISTGMEQWRDRVAIDVEVEGIHAPTMTMTDGDSARIHTPPPVIAGMCLPGQPSRGATRLQSIDDLIDTEKRLADYLDFVLQQL